MDIVTGGALSKSDTATPPQPWTEPIDSYNDNEGDNMSNCIRLSNRCVRLLADEIDIPKFKVQVDKALAIKRSEDLEAGDGNTYIHWWFLSTNVHFDHHGVDIHFEDGRSIHTWRDFRHTINTLNQYMKKSKKHVFVIEDEGMEYINTHTIDFAEKAEF